VSDVVVKVGGHAVATPSAMSDLLGSLATEIPALIAHGHRVTIVHGAGPQIDADLAAQGIDGQFVDGLRVTDDATLAVVASGLRRVQRDIVAGLIGHAVSAEGVAGDDGLLTAEPLGPPWGHVGAQPRVDVSRLPIDRMLVPVVSPLARDAAGSLVNCNADVAAGALAGALSAAALIYLSDVAHVRADSDDPTSAIPTLTAAAARELIAAGSIRGGMVPKVTAALTALSAGASRVVITDGQCAGSLTRALGGAAGTVVVT
jgi:acetylglutamate kinase